MTKVSEGLSGLFLFGDIRLVLLLAGLLMSVVLHELLHVLLHWGYVTSISVFPAPFVIAEVRFLVAPGYDIIPEEIAAYALSIAVLVLTLMKVLSIPSRKTGKTTVQQLVGVVRLAAERASA